MQDTRMHNEPKMNDVKKQVQDLIRIVNKLEHSFPGRHFTLDGHIVGSIGEVMASYYYGVELYSASTAVHDGEVKEKRVQIKTTQRDDIVISHEPDYLIVLYLNKNGNIYEVYNGPGKEPWECASKKDSHNNRHMRVNKLLELDSKVSFDDRISPTIGIKKMKAEYKNK